ncbi:acetylcholine receptor subunit alpha-type unc-63-like [Convolutriloba macropyga]|uniref:acetylcholine receptor subunit alpha-type unc-63-like n=1 Tax=Convolutriloba macropyga TaxID=536237 RepID=UPI003F521F16
MEEAFTRFIENSDYEMVFTIKLKRKPLFYTMILIVPIVTVYMLSGLTFLLPSDSGEKVGFAMTELLAQIVAFATLSNIFPASSDNIPLLLHFVSVITLHMALLCLVSVFVVSLTQNGWKKWMGRGLRNLIGSDWLKYIGLTPFSNKGAKMNFKLAARHVIRERTAVVIDRLGSSPYGASVDGDEDKLRLEKEKNDLRWRFFAVVVDRVCLIIHVLILVTNVGFFAIMLLL